MENLKEAVQALSIIAENQKDDELVDLAQAAREDLKALTDPFAAALYQVENGWIETFTGKAFHILDPKADEICIEDIAHALSLQCRYNGHTNRFYSVAEHSVALANYVFKETGGKRLARTMLLHDAAEAYVGDLPRPIKHILPQFSILEDKIFAVIAEKFDIFAKLPEYIKGLDSRILVDERSCFMGKTTNEWGTDKLCPLKVSLKGLSPEEAERAFLKRFYALSSLA
jgi:hypothetical protein